MRFDDSMMAIEAQIHGRIWTGFRRDFDLISDRALSRLVRCLIAVVLRL